MSLLQELWSPEGRRGPAAFLWPLLLPPEGLFRAAVSLRGALYGRGWLRSRSAPVAVLSVGGIEAGGVGKTPLVAELLRLADHLDLSPAVVLRGYGGSRAGKAGSARVPIPLPERASSLFGDEAVWLAERSATWKTAGIWVARERLEGALAAAEAGARLVLLDDGLQHRRLRRDGELISLSGTHPLANRHLLPAGPLRERPAAALGRADCVVLSQVGAEGAASAARRLRPFLRETAPVRSWHGQPDLRGAWGAEVGPGEPVLLCAGIAHPERALDSLRRLGHPARAWLFPDHHRFSEGDLRRLAARSVSESIPLVTTEKDWIRLREVARPGGPEGLRLSVLSQRVCWNEADAEADLCAWMRGMLRQPERAERTERSK